MMSIPRDTYITSEYYSGHKLNGIYNRGKKIIPLVEKIQELLSVKIDYYLIFDTQIVHELVDAIGGVEIDVPMRMKYDDPTQDLHIDLQPGLQVLNGNQAEMFVRFRHNNDMSVGYAMGDLKRVEVQQEFLKKFIKTVVSPSNITKIPELINIALKNTDTNITIRDALKYVPDAGNINTENIISYTAAGGAEYIDGVSYFLLDKEETKKIIEEEFNSNTSVEAPDGATVSVDNIN